MTNLVEILITGKDLSKKAFEEAHGSAAGLGSVLTKVGLAGAVALAGIAVESVKMAATYESATTRLVTSANESTANINMVSKGMLNMASQVGMTADELAKGMYTVESAGYHGADGLIVLKAAAQGAKDENADLGTVANAVTDVLTDYHMKASDAADVTSKLVTAVSFGKTTFEAFSKAMSNVLPLSGAVHLSLADVSGVLAEMTAHGMTAQRASQNEAQAIRSLIAPTGTMTKEFKLMGITSDEVMKKMGTVGLSGTLQWLSDTAAAGAPKVGQSYVEALKKLMGTAPGLSVALMTTGENAKSTNAAIEGIGKATADAKGDVKGFAEVQKTLAQQLSQVDAWFNSMMIRLGTALIPKVTEFLSLLQSKGGPVLGGFSDVLSHVADGFNKVKDAVDPVGTIMASFNHPGGMNVGGERIMGSKQPMVAQLPGGERPILPAGAAAIAKSVAAMQPPDTSGWAKVGQALRKVADDLDTFVGQAVKAGGQLASALQPTLALLGTTGLITLQAIGTILSTVVGPALVKVTGFMNDHKTAVRDLIAVALVPLGIRLAALAIIKPVTAIASLAVDIVKFPFTQAKLIGSAVSSGWSTISYTAGQMKLGAQMLGQYALVGWGKISSGASTTGHAIADLASAGWSKLASGVSAAGRGVASLASTSWTALTDGLAATGRGLKIAADASLDFSKKAVLATGAAVKQAAAFVWDKTVLYATAAAQKAATAGQWLLNAALDANPIGVVILAVAALAAGFYELYKHSEAVRESVAEFWGLTEMATAAAVKLITQSLGVVVEGFDAFVGEMIHGAASAFGWIPGLGGQLKGAARDFDTFKANTSSAFNTVIAKANSFGDAAAKATAKRTLQVKIDGWTDNLNKAKAQLSSVPSSKRAALLANIADLENKIALAKASIASVKSKTVFLNVVGTYTPAPFASQNAHAYGGIISGAATGGARGGWTQINEMGPELVRLPTGSMVYPTGQSQAMAAAVAGGGGGQLQVEWVGGNAGDDFLRWLRKNIRITGGTGPNSVQKALS